MKLRKILAVTAVAATMTAAFAVNAMAEESLTLNAGSDFTYDAKTGIITLTTNKQPSAAPYTMLVVASDEEGLDATIADTDIKQIDESSTAFATINVGTLAEGTYEIRLGGDGQVRWGTLEVKAPQDDKTVLVGDANNSGDITVADVAQIAIYTVTPEGNTTVKESDKNYQAAAYSNGNATVEVSDAAQVAIWTVSPDKANALINTEVVMGSITE